MSPRRTLMRSLPGNAARLIAEALGVLAGRLPPQPTSAARAELLAFLTALPASTRGFIADDVKRLIGWATDAAFSGQAVPAGRIVDARAGSTHVPGFSAPSDMQGLSGRYRVVALSKDGGYWGLILELLDQGDQPQAVILVNRLFRLPVLLQDPLGVASDVASVAALMLDFSLPATRAAAAAAETARALACRYGVPLVLGGQSLAGGLAQFQTAHLKAGARPGTPPHGFLTFNAAHAARTIEGLGLRTVDVPGINFSKDLDPGVGPRGPFPNRVGLQVYIHPDGSGSLTPGPTGLANALLHPFEHFLWSFDAVSLGEVLRPLGLIDDRQPACRVPR